LIVLHGQRIRNYHQFYQFKTTSNRYYLFIIAAASAAG